MNKITNWRGLRMEELSPEEFAKRQEIAKQSAEWSYEVDLQEWISNQIKNR